MGDVAHQPVDQVLGVHRHLPLSLRVLTTLHDCAIAGDVVWAPGVDGALVLGMRGGDFILDIGPDFSIGYLTHDGELVTPSRA